MCLDDAKKKNEEDELLAGANLLVD